MSSCRPWYTKLQSACPPDAIPPCFTGPAVESLPTAASVSGHGDVGRSTRSRWMLSRGSSPAPPATTNARSAGVTTTTAVQRCTALPCSAALLRRSMQRSLHTTRTWRYSAPLTNWPTDQVTERSPGSARSRHPRPLATTVITLTKKNFRRLRARHTATWYPVAVCRARRRRKFFLCRIYSGPVR